jgi:hypothetical protein
MTDPIRAALDKAACAICLCEGECFETRHGMMHGPCEKLTGEAANAIARRFGVSQHFVFKIVKGLEK